MFRLSDIECDFLASMASNKTRTYISVEDALRDILDSDFEVDSGSEFGDLSSSEEEMIDTGCDPEVESAVARYVQGFFLFMRSIHYYIAKYLVFMDLCNLSCILFSYLDLVYVENCTLYTNSHSWILSVSDFIVYPFSCCCSGVFSHISWTKRWLFLFVFFYHTVQRGFERLFFLLTFI